MIENRQLIRRTAASVAIIAILAVLVAAPATFAVPQYQGGVGAISFGVAPYGAPVPGVPTYIANNFNGRTDILTSPGGTFLTASPVIANNIASYAGPLPGAAFQVGGGNINGPFGSGAIIETGTSYGIGLTDFAAGGGSASYAIGSMTSNFNEPVGYVGTWGSYLAIGGILPGPGTAGVAALRSFVTSANPASPFFGGVELPQLVLANSRGPGNTYSFVALGGSGAAMVVGNAAVGNFRGLAVNNLPIIAIPAGDNFTVVSTLTVYADPSEMFMLNPGDVADLMGATGNLPGFVLFDNTTAAIPEAGALWLMSGVAFVSLAGCWTRCKRSDSTDT